MGQKLHGAVAETDATDACIRQDRIHHDRFRITELMGGSCGDSDCLRGGR